MQTKNSKPTPRVQEQPEQFDEFTGGYDMEDHNRAAARINADLRKMPTPRQWHYSEPVASHRKPFVYDQNGNLVANFDGWVGRSYEENVANAKLAASAPDLLEALQTVLRHCVTPAGMPDKGKGRTPEQQAAYDAARAAIARATGGGQ
jgi:hypothetical protein